MLATLALALALLPPAAQGAERAPDSHPSFELGYLFPVAATDVSDSAGWLEQGAGCPNPDATPYTQGYYHLGVDLGTAAGTPVYAIADGRVVWTGSSDWDGEGNSAVAIEHTNDDGSTFVALYGHINETATDTVQRGHRIGTIGSFLNFDHLHFGIYAPAAGDPASTFPTTDNGRELCTSWPDDRGFVDPVAYLRSRAPEGLLPPAKVSTALIIDSSGSMGSSDPFDRRLAAARAHLNAANPNDEVGVVDFDGGATIVSEALPVGANRTTLRTAINGIDASGGTDLGAGLDAGFDVLSRARGEIRIAVFLTDGSGSYSDQANRYVQAGWKVFTIGLGGSVPEDLLRGIASDTGGEYLGLADVTDLECEFIQLRSVATGGERTSCETTDLIPNAQTQTLQPVAVTTQLDLLNATVTWGQDLSVEPVSLQSTSTSTSTSEPTEPELRMTLTAPSGRQITRDSVEDDVVVETGTAFESISVLEPEIGEWQVEVTSSGIPDGQQQPFTFLTVQNESEVADEPDDSDGDNGNGTTSPPPPVSDVEVLDEVAERCTLEARDINVLNVHFDDICELFTDGVITGFDDGSIRPSSTVTRGQFASVIAREMGVERASGGVASFTDTEANVHGGNIEALFELEIIDGFGDGTFRPNASIRRDQAASILAAWLELEPVGGDLFSDVPPGSVHAGTIYALNAAGVIDGTSATTFGSGEDLRRDQFFALVNRAR